MSDNGNEEVVRSILPDMIQEFRGLGSLILNALGKAKWAQSNLVDAAKESDTAGAAKVFIVTRDIQDSIDEAVTELHKLRQVLQITVLPEKFQQANISSLTIDDNRVTISATLSVTMVDKVGGMNWLRENGLQDIIQETVNASTLKATIRKMIEDEGKEPPEDLFKMTPVMNTSVTKVKKKAGT